MLRGSYALNTGSFDEAEKHFDDARSRGRGTLIYAEVLHAGAVFWLHNMRGDDPSFAGVEPMLLELFDEEETNIRTLIQGGIAVARLARGDADGARREYDLLARDDFHRLERDESWLLTMGVLTELAQQLHDAEGAATLYELLLPYDGLALSHDLLRAVAGSVASALGTAATAAGRLADGEAHFERAIAMEREQGLLPALYNSQGGLARLLIRRGRPSDVARARALVEEAEAGARAIGSRRSYREILASAPA